MINKLLKILTILGLIVSGFFITSSSIHADDCVCTVSGNCDIGSDCTFGNLVNGVDTGTESSNTAVLDLQGGVLTINSNQTIAVGSFTLSGGSIAIEGQIKLKMPLWIVDADADGYPSTTTQYAQTSAPANGRRRNVMTSVTVADCDDGAYSASNTCCSLLTWYQDSDGDLYGNPSVSTEACDQPAGYVADNTDCYDSNANAKPGQTTCYTAHRGDGSFDYNCDSTDTRCTNCSTSCTNGSSFWTLGCCGTYPNNYCCNAAWKAQKLCSGLTACGVSGYRCTDARKSTCVTQYPCSLSNNKNISCDSCTPTCR
jgi:hypothetical protein